MKKQDYIEKVAKETGYNRKDIRLVIDTLVDVICDGLLDHEKITLHGLGTFSTVKRPERVCTNVQDPTKKITVPEHYACVFKPSNSLKKGLKTV